MKVLVTGGDGQLAHDVIYELVENDIPHKSIDISDADITNENEIKNVINEYKPTHVVHCAAYTAVDKAEDNPELVYKINVLGTKYIAEICKEIDATMVYISTDYIFEGNGAAFYEENDTPNPQSVYGLTKYQGELEVQKTLEKYYIIRISWVFGVHGSNFVKTMIKLGNERESLSVVSDQIGSPTYTADVAKLIIQMINTNKYGVFHATNEGICSWYEFTKEIFEILDITCNLSEIKSIDYPTKAKRPYNSRMSKDKLVNNGFSKLRPWKEALREMISQL